MRALFIFLFFLLTKITSAQNPINLRQLDSLDLNIVSVDYKSGIHEITGYDSTRSLVTKKVIFGLDSVLPVSIWTRPKVSIVTVPLKMRPEFDTFPPKAQAGLTNIGLSFNLVN